MADLKSSQPPEERATPYTPPDDGETLNGQDSAVAYSNKSSLPTPDLPRVKYWRAVSASYASWHVAAWVRYMRQKISS